MVRKKNRNFGFRKIKIFSLLLVVFALPVFLFVSNQEESFEVRTQAAIKNDLDSVDAKIKKNQKNKKDKKNTVLLYERKELMKELGYNYPKEFLKKVKTKKEKQKFPKNQQALIEEDIKIKGEFVKYIAEDFDNNKSKEGYSMQVDDESFELSIANINNRTDSDNLLSGSNAEVVGFIIDELIVADKSEVKFDIKGINNTIQRILVGRLPNNYVVQLVNFKGDRRKPYTVKDIRREFFAKKSENRNSAQAYFSTLSKGKYKLNGQVFSYIQSNLTRGEFCNGGVWKLNNEMLRKNPALTAGGAIAYIYPNPKCGWAGWASVGGTRPVMWASGNAGLRTIAHELGHNFGFDHSNRISCVNINPIKCGNEIEYGDRSDIMGGRSVSNLSIMRHISIGFRPLSIMRNIDKTGYYRVYKFGTSNNPKLIKFDVPNTQEDLFFEYRGGKKQYDSNSVLSLKQGILLYRWNGIRSSPTQAISRNYNTPRDHVLRDGQVVRVSGYKIKQINHNSNYATFRIYK